MQQHADMPPSKVDTPPAKDATQVAGANGGGPSGDVAGLLDALKQALAGLTALLDKGTLGGGPGGKDDPAQKGVEQIGQVPPSKVDGENGGGVVQQGGDCDMPTQAPTQAPTQKGEEPSAKADEPPAKGQEPPTKVGGRHGGKPGWGHGGFGPPGKFGWPGQFPGQFPGQVAGANGPAPSKSMVQQGIAELRGLGVNIPQSEVDGQSGPGQKSEQPPSKVEADSGPGQKSEPVPTKVEADSGSAVPSGSSDS